MEADFFNRVKDKNIIRRHAHVVLGLSGGPDSMCLFDVLIRLREEYDLNVMAVHVNHNIRGEASDEDQRYVQRVCAEKQIPLRVVSIDCQALARETGKTTEEAGRDARYQAFREAAGEMERSGAHPRSIAIAVAHNADDQVETVLQRIIRGTGVDGLAGMEPIRKDESGYHIIRPLISEWKKDILEYCEERDLSPRMDHTNDEPRYMRNKIRLELIPQLENYNPEVKKALLRLAGSAAQDSGTLRYMGEMAYQGSLVRKKKSSTEGAGEERTVRLSDSVKGLEQSVARRVFKKALEDIGLTQDVNFVHYKAIEDLLRSDSPSAETELPGGYKVRREYDDLVFLAPEAGEDVIPEINTLILDVRDGKLQGEDPGKRNETGRFAVFDGDLLAAKYGEGFADLVEIRYRKPGDYISIGGGKKKIQDLLVDMKVPRYERDLLPICCIGNDVLFIPVKENVFDRARYTKDYGVSVNTKRAFLIEVIG